MQFVDEQHNTRISTAHLIENRAKAFLKLPSKFGARNQSPQIQRHKPQVLKGVGHLARDDALGQQLGNGGLANAGSTNQHGVVLAATRQHLDQIADFGIASDHRIEIASFRLRCQIPAVGLQRCWFPRQLRFWDRWGQGLGARARGEGCRWSLCHDGLRSRGWGRGGDQLTARRLLTRSRARGRARSGALQFRFQTVRGQAQLIQKFRTDAWVSSHGNQHMGNVDQA